MNGGSACRSINCPAHLLLKHGPATVRWIARHRDPAACTWCGAAGCEASASISSLRHVSGADHYTCTRSCLVRIDNVVVPNNLDASGFAPRPFLYHSIPTELQTHAAFRPQNSVSRDHQPTPGQIARALHWSSRPKPKHAAPHAAAEKHFYKACLDLARGLHPAVIARPRVRCRADLQHRKPGTLDTWATRTGLPMQGKYPSNDGLCSGFFRISPIIGAISRGNTPRLPSCRSLSGTYWCVALRPAESRHACAVFRGSAPTTRNISANSGSVSSGGARCRSGAPEHHAIQPVGHARPQRLSISESRWHGCASQPPLSSAESARHSLATISRGVSIRTLREAPSLRRIAASNIRDAPSGECAAASPIACIAMPTYRARSQRLDRQRPVREADIGELAPLRPSGRSPESASNVDRTAAQAEGSVRKNLSPKGLHARPVCHVRDSSACDSVSWSGANKANGAAARVVHSRKERPQPARANRYLHFPVPESRQCETARGMSCATARGGLGAIPHISNGRFQQQPVGSPRLSRDDSPAGSGLALPLPIPAFLTRRVGKHGVMVEAHHRRRSITGHAVKFAGFQTTDPRSRWRPGPVREHQPPFPAVSARPRIQPSGSRCLHPSRLVISRLSPAMAGARALRKSAADLSVRSSIALPSVVDRCNCLISMKLHQGHARFPSVYGYRCRTDQPRPRGSMTVRPAGVARSPSRPWSWLRVRHRRGSSIRSRLISDRPIERPAPLRVDDLERRNRGVSGAGDR